MFKETNLMVDVNSAGYEMAPFFEMTPDLVCIAGRDGFFRKVNRSVIDKLGYTEEELKAVPISTFIHADDRELTNSHRMELLKGKALINFQNRYVSKTNRVFWLAWTSIYLPEEEIVFAIAKDITQGKLGEKEIEEKYRKFKSLAGHFKSSMEKDRKFLAVELHEELAQLASVVKMDLHSVRNHASGLDNYSIGILDHALDVSGVLINTIRRISYSISPGLMDDMGFDETIQSLCDEFAVLNGIRCRYETTYATENLPHEIKLDFFRICQESLINIMYYARAGEVNISIDEVNDKIHLRITDDGDGLVSEDTNTTYRMKSMRERTASINGEFSIFNEAGKGTTISVIIPHVFGND